MEYETAVRVSGAIIRLAISENRFSESDVHSILTNQVDPEEVRVVARQLTKEGWIERPESKLEYWRAGPLARVYGNMVRYRQDVEGTIPVMPDERNE